MADAGMVFDGLVAAGLPAVGAAIATAAAWRAHAGWKATGSPGLAGPRAAFALLAVAGAAQALQAGAYTISLEHGGPARGGLGGFDVLFWVHHAAILAAIGALARAYTLRATPALVPLLLVAGPVLWVAEAVGLLGLTVWTARNHARRASPRSLLVACGFLLLCTALALMAWSGTPLGARPLAVEAAWTGGLVALWQGLPRRPRLG